VPGVHDLSPPGRARHGPGAVRGAGVGAGPGPLPIRHRRGCRSARRDLRHAGHARHACRHRRERVLMKGHATRRRHGLARMAALTLAVAASAAPLAAQQKAQPVRDTVATLDDARVSLGAGEKNSAGIALSNMRLVSYTPKPADFDRQQGLAFVNSDLAFRGNLVYQGNFSGFMIWDVSDPAKPQLVSSVLCATDQGDPSIYGDLLFISA